MAYFPMFIDLEGKKCLVVGGGRVAARKAVQLLDFGADLLVVAKEASPEMQRLAESGGPDGNYVFYGNIDCRLCFFII